MQKGIVRIFTLIPAVWLIAESGYGVLQVLGLVRSGHALFAITGHFPNPGPYGGFVGMLTAICATALLQWRGEMLGKKMEFWLLAVGVALGLIVLPASMSRAGWLSLVLSLAIWGIRTQKIQSWFRGKLLRAILALLVLIIVCQGLFVIKKDSALGRLHIWHMEALSIMNHPWTGVGPGYFAYEYGERQAIYFQSAVRPAWEIRVASCPEYAFNEYLKVGVEWGVDGLFLSSALAIGCCLLLIRKDNPLGYGAVSLSVFSFFSYPLVFWQFQFFAGLYLFAAVGTLFQKNSWFPFIAFLLIAFSWRTGRIKHTQSSDYRELYAQGHLLFDTGEYELALSILEEGAAISCDPMFHNVMGRCHEALGRYLEAEREYRHAHYMVPGRLYPLILLQEMYLSQKDTLRAVEVLSEIEAIPVNPKNPNMKSLHERAEQNMNKI